MWDDMGMYVPSFNKPGQEVVGHVLTFIIHGLESFTVLPICIPFIVQNAVHGLQFNTPDVGWEQHLLLTLPECHVPHGNSFR